MPGPYPLATLSATINANGISAPVFADIFASLQASYFGIYGNDANLAADSQDGQWLGVIAKKIDDANQMAIAVYNQFSPATAIGVGLSQNVKLNGMRRSATSNSQANITIVGQAFATILNGIVGDNANLGTQWNLPASVTIPASGTIVVGAVCSATGAIAAAPNTLNVILTPSPGWQTATNAAAAIPGLPVESDAALRLRQSISTALSALTVLEAIAAAVANVPGVSRVKPYQNDTNVTDANGVPAHNVAMVVSGGDPIAVATAIASKKPPGGPTYGTTAEVVIDSKGVPSNVNFFVLTNVTLSVLIFVTPLQGYVSSTGLLAAASVVAFLNGRAIGQSSYRGSLWAPANLSGTAAQQATSQPQTQLDALSATYDLTEIAQARSDMTVTGGPYGAGALNLNVVNATNYVVGKLGYVYLDNGTLFTVTITSITGVNVSFTPAVPVGRSIPNGALLYTNSDVTIKFNEATLAASANVTVVGG